MSYYRVRVAFLSDNEKSAHLGQRLQQFVLFFIANSASRSGIRRETSLLLLNHPYEYFFTLQNHTECPLGYRDTEFSCRGDCNKETTLLLDSRTYGGEIGSTIEYPIFERSAHRTPNWVNVIFYLNFTECISLGAK